MTSMAEWKCLQLLTAAKTPRGAGVVCSNNMKFLLLPPLERMILIVPGVYACSKALDEPAGRRSED